jgi:hypothetical protein
MSLFPFLFSLLAKVAPDGSRQDPPRSAHSHSAAPLARPPMRTHSHTCPSASLTPPPRLSAANCISPATMDAARGGYAAGGLVTGASTGDRAAVDGGGGVPHHVCVALPRAGVWLSSSPGCGSSASARIGGPLRPHPRGRPRGRLHHVPHRPLSRSPCSTSTKYQPHCRPHIIPLLALVRRRRC